MSYTKQASKRKRQSKAVPVLGAAGLAGLSLSLAGNAATASTAPTGELPNVKNTMPNHEITLGDEEISDVSLGTFYVFDKENASLKPGVQLARGCGGCGCGGRGCGCGGRGCGCGGRGCGCGFGGCGCGGCGGWGWGWGVGCFGGCCLSWGGCRLC